VSAEFTADFFDGRTSRRHAVVVGVHDDTLAIRGDDVAFNAPRSQASVHPRLGTAPVRIALPGGGLLVADFASVDSSLGVPRARTLAHRLESHAAVVVIALLGIVAGGWFAYSDGIPWAARKIAERIPPEVEAELSKEALASADSVIFHPSKLPEEARIAVNREFSSLVASADVPRGTRLELRDGQFLGANAFTLPGGVVVVTDKLVEILEPKEVGAVIAHELGHVHYRHGTRHLLDNSIHALFAMAVFGDVSAVAGLAATVPTVLMNTAYSRDFEREADSYAYQLLKSPGRSPRDFAAALESLRSSSQGERSRAFQERYGYLSTHPDFEERIKAAEDAARKEDRR
jgi:Zn-dependent protease with chaperone function